MNNMGNAILFNLEAESSVLGAVMRDNNSLCGIVDYLSHDDFCEPRHKLIYRAMEELYSSSTPIDVATLYNKLGTAAVEVGGVAYLSQLQMASCTSLNIKAHGDIVKEKASLRALNLLLNNALTKLNGRGGKGEDISSAQIIDELSDALLSLETNKEKEDGKLGPHLEAYLRKLEERYLRGGGIQGIKTGFGKLDKVLGGFNRGDYIILAARPSMGKSAVSVNMALSAFYREKAKVAYFNLEMSTEQTIGRSIASLCLIEMNKLKNGSLKNEEWEDIAQGSSILYDDNIRIFEKSSGINEIRTCCKLLKMSGGLDIVFIDYLQLIRTEEKRYENRNIDVSNISRVLKLMAKELDITVVALSQLSRAPETRSDHRPMLSDLRDSGSIEQDADIVMLLYRDGYYDTETSEPDIIECIVAKNRNGEVGTVKLKWMPEYQKVV